MLAKKIIGIILLVLNTAGLGFMVYRTVLALVERFSPEDEKPKLTPVEETVKKEKPLVVESDVIPEGEDLLKDLDLSDLDDLDLDDFD